MKIVEKNQMLYKEIDRSFRNKLILMIILSNRKDKFKRRLDQLKR